MERYRSHLGRCRKQHPSFKSLLSCPKRPKIYVGVELDIASYTPQLLYTLKIIRKDLNIFYQSSTPLLPFCYFRHHWFYREERKKIVEKRCGKTLSSEKIFPKHISYILESSLYNIFQVGVYRKFRFGRHY